MKLVVRERDSQVASELWDRSSRPSTARVAFVEVRSAIAAAARARRISRSGGSRAAAELESLWSSLTVVELDEQLAEAAADLAEAHGLRALDAIHLAGALTLEDVVLLSWDTRLRQAALDAGVAVAPHQG